VVPDYIDFDTDYNDSGFSVYVRGSTSAGSGWANATYVSPYGANTIIDRPQSDTLAKREAIATAYLRREFAQVRGGRFTVTGFDGWRAGQTVAIADEGLGVSGNYEIKAIEAQMTTGSSVLTYDIYYGTLPWSGTYDIKRKNRRGRNA
jgi:hypothetical protein